MQVLSAILGLSLLLQADPTVTGETVGAPSAPMASPSITTVRLPAGTRIEIELVDGLSSGTSSLGDRFAIQLVEPISIEGSVVVAGGATGEGEVIDVARAGIGGKQGKLIISGRFLDLDGRRVRIRGMSLLASGKSRVDLATGLMLTPYVGLAAVIIPGGDIEIPAGTRATARLAEDVELQINATTVSGGEVE
ncbi:MAG: hypothetical protein Q7T19_04580 [Caulobacter sp.]|nr:hypothetical protein [Caulobacter sp.]